MRTETDLQRQSESLKKEIEQRKLMQAEIERTHRELVLASHQAGMAVVATGVLHNVGNVLNSVNVSATLVAETVRKSKVVNLHKVVGLLDEHAADLGNFFTADTKGTQLPDYLRQLSEHLASEQQSVITELGWLCKNIQHIKEIVARQQEFAKFSGVTETINVPDLIEDALRLNDASLKRHTVQVRREFANLPPINVDKHKTLQILLNLISNAKHACDASGREDKQLTIRAANGGSTVKISISDNGVGIPSENLTRIFNHGFTTKKNGHGFGLHSGANAAKEMGGSLTAYSGGPQCGALFTLELPLEPPKSKC
jgi:C4-dicarboxylate-specific signal transduction histidine kinase